MQTLLLALLLLSALAVRARADARPAVREARGLASKQDWKGARAVLEHALRDEPRDFAANELLGFCLMKLFVFDDACAAFERGDATDRYHDVNLGFCLRKSGRLPEALDAFKRAQFVLGPEDSWAQYCRDQIAELSPLANGRVVACLAQADDLVVLIVNGRNVLRAKAGGEAGAALDPFIRAGRNEVRALAINSAGPFSYRVRLYVGGKLAFTGGKGYSAKGLGAFDGAETAGIVGECACEIAASEEEGPRLVSARELVDMAGALEQEREAEGLLKSARAADAIRLLELGAKDHATLDLFHRRLAEVCDEVALTIQGAGADAAAGRDRLRTEAAAERARWVEVRRKIALLAVDDARAFQALGTACAQTGALADAEKALARSLELDPNRAEAMVALAGVLTKSGKIPEAKAWAGKAIDRIPHWPAAHVALGDALFAAGDAEAALLAYRKGIELDPVQGEWINGKIALVANKGGANALEIAAAEAARKTAPGADAERALGVALMRGLRYEDAIQAFDRALAANPGEPGTYPLLALCCELVGDGRRAVRCSEAGVKDPDEELAQLARRRLPREGLVASPPARAPVATGSSTPDDASGPGKDRALRALKDLEAERPVLARGLRALPPLRAGEVTLETALSVERIRKLAGQAGARAEVRRGLELIEREVRRREGPIEVDGKLGDWDEIERVATDPRGDVTAGAPPGADLAALYAVVDGDSVYLGWAMHDRCEVSRASSAWAHLYPSERGAPWIAVGICADGPALVQNFPDGTRRDVRGGETGIRYEVSDEGIEARVPLRWLDGRRRLQVEGYTYSGSQKWDSIAERQPPVHIDDGYSASLLALERLAEAVDLVPDDRPALAIALDSGDAYAQGDAALDRLVQDDDRRMLRFARLVAGWQRAMGLVPLEELPLPALLFWANRTLQWRPESAIDYRRDAISPATLEAMFRYVQKHGWRGRSAADLIEPIEKHLMDARRWQYTSYEMVAKGVRARAGESVLLSEGEKKELNRFVREVSVDGRKVTTDGSFNPDLEFDYLLATDALLGHCGNLAQAVVDFARASGIPATICQGIEERSAAFQNPHAFPVYFEGKAGVWKSFQGRRYTGIRALTLNFFLPPLTPPARARPSGGGSYWFPLETTYDEAGPLFANGFEADFVKSWMKELRASAD